MTNKRLKATAMLAGLNGILEMIQWNFRAALVILIVGIFWHPNLCWGQVLLAQGIIAGLAWLGNLYVTHKNGLHLSLFPDKIELFWFRVAYINTSLVFCVLTPFITWLLIPGTYYYVPCITYFVITLIILAGVHPPVARYVSCMRQQTQA
jgi:hypothetical protein